MNYASYIDRTTLKEVRSMSSYMYHVDLGTLEEAISNSYTDDYNDDFYSNDSDDQVEDNFNDESFDDDYSSLDLV